MNKNCSYPTTMYESVLTQMYIFLVLFTFYLYYETILRQKLENIFFYQKFAHLEGNKKLYIVVG